MYRLAFRSNLPSAEEFTDWACEIMVSVRRDGYYFVPGMEIGDEPINVEDKVEFELERLNLTLKLKRLEFEIEHMRMTVDLQRLEFDRERLAFDRKQAAIANSAETKKMRWMQLFRELASASKDDDLRDEFLQRAENLID